MEEEKVVLVNRNDEQLGTMPKMEAHEKGVLHRAFSVFITNDRGEMLLQQRAADKYHSPLLWTNACCSHQRVGESNIQAGKRRLQEEMGIHTELTELFSFVYKAPFDNGLIEHEFDHVMMGRYNGEPEVNPAEVADHKWMTPEEIKADIASTPANYTAWFKIIFDRFFEHIQQPKPNNEGQSQ
ncbi:MAG: isopentenyl-diphosphate Delta-isomerase [Flavobacteriaceae bacterium]